MSENAMNWAAPARRAARMLPIRLLGALAGLLATSTCIPRGVEIRSPQWVAVAPAPVAAGNPCFELSLDNVSDEERATLREAFGAVCSVFRDPGFRQFVMDQSTWFSDSAASCRLVAPGQVASDLLDRSPPRLHVVVNWQGLGGTLARTNACVGTPDDPSGFYSYIALGPGRVAKWRSNDGADRGLLVNTIAHELTHTVVNAGACERDAGFGMNQPNRIAYRDGGFDDCTRPSLVSYQFGDAAEAWYRSRGDRQTADRHFEQHVDSEPVHDGRLQRRLRCAGGFTHDASGHADRRACYGFLAADARPAQVPCQDGVRRP
jgi:hypothetical protein